MSVSIFGQEKDHFFMDLALEQAERAARAQEVPIGAVVVTAAGVVIAQAHNQIEHEQSQQAHAEMKAIRLASALHNDWRLDGCWLYVTLEPCSMCMGLIRLSRLAGIVYGADSPLFGYRLDNGLGLRVYNEESQIVIAGVRVQESATLLKQFFKKQRVKKSE